LNIEGGLVGANSDRRRHHRIHNDRARVNRHFVTPATAHYPSASKNKLQNFP